MEEEAPGQALMDDGNPDHADGHESEADNDPEPQRAAPAGAREEAPGTDVVVHEQATVAHSATAASEVGASNAPGARFQSEALAAPGSNSEGEHQQQISNSGGVDGRAEEGEDVLLTAGTAAEQPGPSGGSAAAQAGGGGFDEAAVAGASAAAPSTSRRQVPWIRTDSSALDLSLASGESAPGTHRDHLSSVMSTTPRFFTGAGSHLLAQEHSISGVGLQRTNLIICSVSDGVVQLITDDFQPVTMPEKLFPDGIEAGFIIECVTWRSATGEEARRQKVLRLQDRLVGYLQARGARGSVVNSSTQSSPPRSVTADDVDSRSVGSTILSHAAHNA